MMRCLVARMDGTVESGFAQGSIKPTIGLPVTLDFDLLQRPIGTANLEVIGQQVFAVMTFHRPVNVGGLYPALGGRANHETQSTARVIHDFQVLQVSLCHRQNCDPKIPAAS